MSKTKQVGDKEHLCTTIGKILVLWRRVLEDRNKRCKSHLDVHYMSVVMGQLRTMEMMVSRWKKEHKSYITKTFYRPNKIQGRTNAKLRAS